MVNLQVKLNMLNGPGKVLVISMEAGLLSIRDKETLMLLK